VTVPERVVFKAGPGDYRVRAKDPAGKWREVGGFTSREAAEKYANPSKPKGGRP
jgi:hypothetical protein